MLHGTGLSSRAYKDYVIECGTDEYSITYRYPHSRRCHVTWEQRPAGRSSKSINEVDNFGRMYEFYNGEYGVFTNNCHMFANDLSRFLTYNTRPNSCAVFRPYIRVINVSNRNINAFTSTYSHFRSNCNNYRRKQISFRNNYCERMGTPIIPAAPIIVSTTLSVMDLARRMARELEEMMRRGQK